MPAAALVTARTRVIFIIGAPITQTRSPLLFNRYFTKAGVDRVVVPLVVRPDQVAAFLSVVRQASNCDGVIATVPVKHSLFALVEAPTERARELEAVNVIRRDADGRLSGDMADGPGFWNAASAHGFAPEGKRLALAGAGAAATAIAHEFARRGGHHVSVATSEPGEFDRLARLLAGRIDLASGMPEDLSGYDIAANATPLGMAHAPGTPFTRKLLASLPRRALVADAVSEPAETVLLAQARTLGLATMAGDEMARGEFRLIGDFLGVL